MQCPLPHVFCLVPYRQADGQIAPVGTGDVCNQGGSGQWLERDTSTGEPASWYLMTATLCRKAMWSVLGALKASLCLIFSRPSNRACCPGLDAGAALSADALRNKSAKVRTAAISRVLSPWSQLGSHECGVSEKVSLILYQYLQGVCVPQRMYWVQTINLTKEIWVPETLSRKNDIVLRRLCHEQNRGSVGASHLDASPLGMSWFFWFCSSAF